MSPMTFSSDRFWTLYEIEARLPIERACRAIARSRSGGVVDADDLVSWVDRKVWTMLRAGAAPTFHDHPTPEEAIARIVRHAATLARWAYLAESRGAFRRTARLARLAERMSMPERLAMVHAEPAAFERREAVRARLAELRTRLDADLRARIAASHIDRFDREKLAVMLGATRDRDTALVDRASGDMKRNTVEQMRSRALRRAREVLAGSARVAGLALAACVILLAGEARAGDDGQQSGGRKPAPALHQAAGGFMPIALDGEQSGGRGGKGGKSAAALAAGAWTPSVPGEQSGGRRRK